MAAAHPTSTAWKIIPLLYSSDLTRTADFFSQKLGFMAAPDPDKDFLSVAAGPKAEANIYFMRCSDHTKSRGFGKGHVFIAVGTDALDQLYVRLQDDGTVRIVNEIGDKPWGYRQFDIADPDDNLITFFKFLEGGNPGTE